MIWIPFWALLFTLTALGQDKFKTAEKNAQADAQDLTVSNTANLNTPYEISKKDCLNELKARPPQLPFLTSSDVIDAAYFKKNPAVVNFLFQLVRSPLLSESSCFDVKDLSAGKITVSFGFKRAFGTNAISEYLDQSKKFGTIFSKVANHPEKKSTTDKIRIVGFADQENKTPEGLRVLMTTANTTLSLKGGEILETQWLNGVLGGKVQDALILKDANAKSNYMSSVRSNQLLGLTRAIQMKRGIKTTYTDASVEALKDLTNGFSSCKNEVAAFNEYKSDLTLDSKLKGLALKGPECDRRRNVVVEADLGTWASFTSATAPSARLLAGQGASNPRAGFGYCVSDLVGRNLALTTGDQEKAGIGYYFFKKYYTAKSDPSLKWSDKLSDLDTNAKQFQNPASINLWLLHQFVKKMPVPLGSYIAEANGMSVDELFKKLADPKFSMFYFRNLKLPNKQLSHILKEGNFSGVPFMIDVLPKGVSSWTLHSIGDAFSFVDPKKTQTVGFLIGHSSGSNGSNYLYWDKGCAYAKKHKQNPSSITAEDILTTLQNPVLGPTTTSNNLAELSVPIQDCVITYLGYRFHDGCPVPGKGPETTPTIVQGQPAKNKFINYNFDEKGKAPFIEFEDADYTIGLLKKFNEFYGPVPNLESVIALIKAKVCKPDSKPSNDEQKDCK